LHAKAVEVGDAERVCDFPASPDPVRIGVQEGEDALLATVAGRLGIEGWGHRWHVGLFEVPVQVLRVMILGLGRRYGVPGVDEDADSGDAHTGQRPLVAFGPGVVAGDGRLDLADVEPGPALIKEVVQDRAADGADQVDFLSGLDNAARQGQFLAGGLQGGGETGPVRVGAAIKRAVTCCFFGFEVKAVYGISAISASEIQHPSSSSKIALGYLIAVQAPSSMLAMACLIEAFMRTVMEKRAPRERQAAITSAA
jgi:hypothetical protein